MKYAIGVTVLGVGALLIYSGWKDVPLWDTFLQTIRGTSTMPPSTVSVPTMSPTGARGGAVGTGANTSSGGSVPVSRNSSGSF